MKILQSFRDPGPALQITGLSSGTKIFYESPEIHLIEIQVEKGFAISPGQDSPDIPGFGQDGW